MIRLIESTDLAACVLMLAALAAEEDGVAPTYQDIVSYTGVISSIIAGDGWGLVDDSGKAMVLVNQAPDGGYVVFGLYVRPENRRQGIAKRLVDSCKNEAQKRGVGSLQFIVKHGRSVGYYERMGATPVETIYELRL